jgi:hypothetical protein
VAVGLDNRPAPPARTSGGSGDWAGIAGVDVKAYPPAAYPRTRSDCMILCVPAGNQEVPMARDTRPPGNF